MTSFSRTCFCRGFGALLVVLISSSIARAVASVGAGLETGKIGTAGPVIFAGSSSIERWTTLQQDFSGYTLINRGVGGSQLPRVLSTLDREILAEKPSVVVLYVGENDLASGQTPAQVIGEFDSLVSQLRTHLPETRLVVLSIKPSPSRWSLHAAIEETNALLKERVSRDAGMRYVDVYSAMLNDAAEPRPELYYTDQLHLSPEGYKLWADQVRPLLGAWPQTSDAAAMPASRTPSAKPAAAASASKVVASVR